MTEFQQINEDRDVDNYVNDGDSDNNIDNNATTMAIMMM